MNGKKITPNEKQQAAIDHSYTEPAVVTAAAGSGKTTLLVERVVLLLSDPALGVDPGSLAIMTFTRNAAKSLREKLNKRLNARFDEEKDPDARDHIKEQIFGLRRAYISTIDAFCLRIIKENPISFDLPMNFTLTDTPKKITMQLRAIDLAMQDLYDNDDLFSEEERRTLFYTFSFKDDELLKKAVMSTADTLSTFADADKWLNDAEDAYKDISSLEKKYINVFLPLVKSDHSRANKILERYQGLESALDSETENIKEGGKTVENDSKFANYVLNILPNIKKYIDYDIRRYEEFRANCEAFEKTPSTEALCKIFSDLRAHGAPPKVDSRSGTSTEKRSFFTKTKQLSEKLSGSILKNDFDPESTLSSLPSQQAVIHSFVKLVRAYIKYYDDIKKSSGCIDFSDCELLLLNKLKDKEFRDMLSSRFSCIIVDEFQDSNDIQAEIFGLLGNGHLFYVGDIKQSIYAFRGGDPEIMAELCGGKDGFRTLPLNMNFRSRTAVIDVINAAFSGLMTREYGGVDYELSENRLVYGAEDYPEIPEAQREKYKCEICFVKADSSDEKDTAAPKFVAEKIRAIHDDPDFTITKNGVLVRPDYSDFAVLLRKKANIESYRKALRELGIDSTSPAGKDLLGSDEIRLLICYLTVVDDPMRDEELLKVLMSPIYRLDADEIGLIRLGLLGLDKAALNDAQKRAYSKKMKSYSLYQCARICSEKLIVKEFNGICEDEPLSEDIGEIPRTANKKLETFLSDLNEFRYYKSSSSVYRLVCKICEDTDLASFTAVLDSSTNSIANIRRFCDMAADFEERDGGNLSDFLRFIEYIRSDNKTKKEETSGAAEAPNAVRIMTFHGSKGLEVPICIMSDLDNVLSQDDMKGTVLLSRELGIAMTDVDIKKRVRSKPLAYRALAENNRARLCGDELRLLYVAMTRAREKLIMVVPGKFNDWKDIRLDPDNIDELFVSSQPFKWVFASLMRRYDEDSGRFKGLECTLSGDLKKERGNDGKGEDEETENLIAEALRDETEEEPGADEFPKAQLDGEDKNDKYSKPPRALSDILSEKINFVYKYDEDTRRREKYSVTELAHRNSAIPVVLTKPKFAADAKLSGADKGNAYHNCMQYLPLDKLQKADPSEYEEIVKSSIQTMKERGRLSETEVGLIDKEHITKFFSGELGQRMFKAKAVRREQPFYAEVEGKSIGEDDLGEITLQGRVDLYFIEDGGIVVVDYKSDNKFNLEKERDNYAKQVKIYSTVLPMLTGVPVKDIYLYAFLADEAIKINDK